jgi:hypothetical protein
LDLPIRSQDFYWWTDRGELAIRAVVGANRRVEALQGRTEVVVRDDGTTRIANSFVELALRESIDLSQAMSMAWRNVVGTDAGVGDSAWRATTVLVRRIARASWGGRKRIIYDPDLIDDLVSTPDICLDRPRAPKLARCFEDTRFRMRTADDESDDGDSDDGDFLWTAVLSGYSEGQNEYDSQRDLAELWRDNTEGND